MRSFWFMIAIILSAVGEMTGTPSPKLDVVDQEMTLASGQTLLLRCTGISPLEWRLSRPLTKIANRTNITTSLISNDSSDEQLFESRLTINRLEYQDTGKITCGYSNESLSANQSSVYIYVYDGEHLMTITGTHLNVDVGQSFEIPCRPTHPNVTVKLLPPSFSAAIFFDRRIGFYGILKNYPPTSLYICQATLNGNTSKAYISVTVAAPPPVLWLKSNLSSDEVLAGETFSIECRATIQSENRVLNMKWKYFNRDKNLSRIVETHPMMSSATAWSTLTVMNATKTDSGSYRCEASEPNSKISAQELKIIVHDKPFVNLSTSPLHEADARQKFNIFIEVSAYPPRPKLLWFKDNQPIQSKNNRVIDYNQMNLSKVLAPDAGNYTVLAVGRYYNSSVHFQLLVNVVPTVVIDENVKAYHQSGETYTLTCRGVGRPTPALQWFWQKCTNVSCVDDKEWTEVKTNGNLSDFEVAQTNITASVATTVSIKAKDSGLLKCTGRNRLGIGHDITRFIVPGEQNTSWSISTLVAIIASAAVLLTIFCISLWISIRRKPPKIYITNFYDKFLAPVPVHKCSHDEPLLDQVEHLGYDPRWEFPKDRLKFKTILGQGAFGMVVKAVAVGIDNSSSKKVVAVKMVKDEGDAEQLKILSSELKIMTNIGTHPNILRVIGAVTREINKGQLYVIVEYCRHGCLRDYLVKNCKNFINTMNDSARTMSSGDQRMRSRIRPSTTDENVALNSCTYENYSEYDSDYNEHDALPLTTNDLVAYAFQIARGMEYLTSRNYIHGDLAARNVLLADKNVVKICDFGLAKNCYKTNEYLKKSNTPVPVKWMALESLMYRTYNVKTDVWSYGILLWELFTLGCTPYSTMTINEGFVELIKQGLRLEKPPYCNETTYVLMRQCWDNYPGNRPNFTELAEFFGNLLQANVKQQYMLFDTQYETPRSNIPLNYVQLDISSSSNSDVEDELSSCPTTPSPQSSNGQADAPMTGTRKTQRQCSVESGVFSMSHQRMYIPPKSTTGGESFPLTSIIAASPSVMEEEMTPGILHNDYILASPTANGLITIHDEKRLEAKRRCSQQSLTSDLSSSEMSDSVFDNSNPSLSGHHENTAADAKCVISVV